MAEYIWSNPDWPDFTWNHDAVMARYMLFANQEAVTSAAFECLLPESRKVIFAENIAHDAVESSALEGVSVSFEAVYGSVAEMLELEVPHSLHIDRNSLSIAKILNEAFLMNTSFFSIEKMLEWHSGLFEGLSQKARPKVCGSFRKGPVYVMKYSGAMEGEILYEGVPAEQIPEDMDAFLSFIRDESIPDAIRSAVAALWFPLIHPFQDGNGRLSRIISDMVLFGGKDSRCISVSSAIRKNSRKYYALLERMDTSRNLDITEWICWYMDMIIDALRNAESACREKIRLSMFMATLDPSIYNSREMNMLYRLASGSFYGHLTAEKWKKMTKCTAATATRDLAHLVERELLIREGDGGRGTWYRLNPEILESLAK